MDWLDQNAWAAWLALALVLGAIEAATVDFVFIMLAGGAGAGAVAALAGASFPVQVLSSVAVACALLVLVRPEVKKRLFSGSTPIVLGAAAYVGRRAEVTQEVTVTGGRILLGGEEWSARLEKNVLAVPAGALVNVIAIDGAVAVVTPDDSPPASPLITHE
ncbi:NfeD family protein [Austwickia chelonae]|uniref:NfeD family protein n=1 Tax=Austwickia chelonae TaxID=100225 RepID=UPI000E23B87E|nr:NfeD family protein [Austwickia chelonae]